MGQIISDMMQCTSCQQTNRAVARYCKHCGAALVAVAATNGKEVHTDPDFGPLAGLADLKKTIQRELTAFKNMRTAGFRYDSRNLYTILMGDTGTGKSKVVEVLAKLYFRYGITTKPDPKVVPAVNFVEFTRNLSANIDAAKGGILCIEHVHQLVSANTEPGQSSPIDRLYAELEKRDGDPIVILSSKADGFREYLQANQDVNNRFSLKFYLPDMQVDQMLELATWFVKEKKFQLEPPVAEKLRKRLLYLFRNQQDTEQSLRIGKNGFLVHKEMNHIFSEHFINPSFMQSPTTLLEDDIKGELFVVKTADEVLKELDDFIGMDGVKDFLKKMVDLLRIQQKDAESTGKGQTIGSHMVLTGNPGTGKTTLARKLGEVFAAAGILSSGHVVDVDRSKLVGQYIGETPLLVQKYCNEAMGGVLFIDEAYALKQHDQDNVGQEAIDTLIKRMEDDRGKFIVIAAGYQKEMQQFINANPGMKSRVKDNFFHLPDYTPEQLLAILQLFVSKGGYALEPEAQQKAATYLTNLYNQRTRDFGNGRDVRNLYETILANRAARLVNGQQATYDMNITAADIPGEVKDLSANSVEQLLGELNALTGLGGVKASISNLVDYLEGEKIRSATGAKRKNLNLHFVFTGNPGTGKTTVARILAKIFAGLGILPRGQLIEVTDKDLVAPYVGQTAALTNKVIDSAMGGVLFIDEAYTLSKGNNSFGTEAIDTLLKRMEDDRGKFIVIAAGYAKEMEQFLDSNPGLDSRFTQKILFEDYQPAELQDILLGMVKGHDMQLDAAATGKAALHLQELYRVKDKRFANARTVRNQFEQILQRQSTRLVQWQRSGQTFDPMLILPEDIPGNHEALVSTDEVLKELNELIGLDSVKREIHSLISYLEIEQLRKASGGSNTQLNLHFIFKGRPGTGKTTVGRLLAKLFKQLGVLTKGQLVEVDRAGLVGQYVGQTAPKTTDAINSAMGGMLFVDEAYTLMPVGTPNDFAKEAIDTLLKRMEDDRGKFIVIAAGYSGDMDRFIQANEGLASRFTREIVFEDYNGPELMQIFRFMSGNKGLHLRTEGEPAVAAFFERLYAQRDAKFANGRTVRNIFEQSLQRQSNRLLALKRQGIAIDGLVNILEPEDIIVIP